MSFISDLKDRRRAISIVGMAKNTGKTTTLNYLIEEAKNEQITLGITSAGRDGEAVDLVTGTDKPGIRPYPGAIVSIPSGLFERATAGLEILRITDYHTPIGAVMICRVIDSGHVQIAGPVLTSAHKLLQEEMLSYGAEMIIIDGAIDRRSVASPIVSDAIILATGAVLSRDIKKVADETAHLLTLYGLSQIDDMPLMELLDKSDRITIVDKGESCCLDIKTGIGAGKVIGQKIGVDTKYVYLPGALTRSVIDDIDPRKLKDVTFVVADPTRIFLNARDWRNLSKGGLTVRVLRSIEVIAVSVNPVSPAGYSFERENLIGAIEEAAPGVTVIDVKMH